MSKQICAIINLRNHIPFGRALEYFGWCDVYYSQNTQRPTGKAASESDIDALGIDFKTYSVLLLQHENSADRYAAKLAKKQHPNLVIMGNQHGYYKSILQIKNHPPKDYDLWNTWGPYWLERHRQVMGRDNPKWVNLGSYLHDYYFRTKTWNPKQANHKALVIYEPNTDESFNDPHPEKKDRDMYCIFKTLDQLKLDYDIKAHPLWPGLVGNQDQTMWQPPKPMLDFDIEEILRYSLVIGCRSTVLLDALMMGMPVVGFQATPSQWPDDDYAPPRLKLFPYAKTQTQLATLIQTHLHKKSSYNGQTAAYFLGKLGQVSELYHQFCLEQAHRKQQRTWLKKVMDQYL